MTTANKQAQYNYYSNLISTLEEEKEALRIKRVRLELFLDDVISVSSKDNLFEASRKMIKASDDFSSGGLIIDNVSFDKGEYKIIAQNIESLDDIIKTAKSGIEEEISDIQTKMDTIRNKISNYVAMRDSLANVTISAAPKKKWWQF